MAESKLVAFVTQLSKKTDEGKISWEKTLDEGVYQSNFPGFSVHLFQRKADIVIQIYNDEGLLIEEIADPDISNEIINGETAYTAMSKMYSLARRKALGVDKALDALLAELGD